MNTTIYTKLPSLVNDAMVKFALSECILVRKINCPNSKPLNCHLNVAAQIEQLGGKVVNGWLLNRSPQLLGLDVWIFTFHSMWETDNGDLFDITTDKNNGRECSTFFIDKANRKIDLTEGVSFNDVVIFNNVVQSNALKIGANPYFKYGEVYWTASNMSLFKTLTESNGEYRFLRAEYPHNYKLLEKQYKLSYTNGTLSLKNGGTHISPYVAFDFSVNLRNKAHRLSN